MTVAQPIDTSRVSRRQTLHFKTLDEALADAAQLVHAEKSGRLIASGNWSLGQNLGHLASWVNYSFDGLPMKVPWIVKLIMRTMKNRTLYKPMPPGRHIPGVAGGTLGAEPLSTDEGFERITNAYARLNAAAPAIPHALFGPMTHDEWLHQHLRHAELHLSFFSSTPIAA